MEGRQDLDLAGKRSHLPPLGATWKPPRAPTTSALSTPPRKPKAAPKTAGYIEGVIYFREGGPDGPIVGMGFGEYHDANPYVEKFFGSARIFLQPHSGTVLAHRPAAD